MSDAFRAFAGSRIFRDFDLGKKRDARKKARLSKKDGFQKEGTGRYVPDSFI